MTREELTAKINELTDKRTALIAEANRQIGNITGRIELCQEMLALLDEEPKENNDES